jgi:hypothetical protein
MGFNLTTKVLNLNKLGRFKGVFMNTQHLQGLTFNRVPFNQSSISVKP